MTQVTRAALTIGGFVVPFAIAFYRLYPHCGYSSSCRPQVEEAALVQVAAGVAFGVWVAVARGRPHSWLLRMCTAIVVASGLSAFPAAFAGGEEVSSAWRFAMFFMLGEQGVDWGKLAPVSFPSSIGWGLILVTFGHACVVMGARLRRRLGIGDATLMCAAVLLGARTLPGLAEYVRLQADRVFMLIGAPFAVLLVASALEIVCGAGDRGRRAFSLTLWCALPLWAIVLLHHDTRVKWQPRPLSKDASGVLSSSSGHWFAVVGYPQGWSLVDGRDGRARWSLNAQFSADHEFAAAFAADESRFVWHAAPVGTLATAELATSDLPRVRLRLPFRPKHLALSGDGQRVIAQDQMLDRDRSCRLGAYDLAAGSRCFTSSIQRRARCWLPASPMPRTCRSRCAASVVTGLPPWTSSGAP